MTTRLSRSRYVLSAGRAIPCDESWRDAFAVVTHGVVEVRTPNGGGLRLVAGDVLCLARVGPAILLAVGPDDAVVTAVRRVTDAGAAP